ncbi:MAG: hypothetical protein O6831_10120 [Alphaproteobacteria bacterium]|nr:hypothetical protein [Alphaproteobacteria bacterium]
MNYLGIVSYSGMAVGRGGGVDGTTMALAPAGKAARVGEVQAEHRRHILNVPLRNGRPTGGVDTRLPVVIEVPARRTRAEPHQGTVLAFLAQHIAQEVAPEVAGLDRHASAARAYMGARDFNAEMLPQGAGLDIRI